MKPHILINCVYDDYSAALRADARDGLTRRRKRLSTRWCFDGRGRRLFESITSGGDYRLGMAERELLTGVAGQIMAETLPQGIVHIGSIGLARARPLWLSARSRSRLPVGICDTPHAALEDILTPLSAELPRADWYGVYTELPTTLPQPPGDGRLLFTCLGESFSALDSTERHRLLNAIRRRCRPGDRLLVTTTTQAADTLDELSSSQPRQVAEFNRNVLYVLNHTLDTECTEAAFDHVYAPQPGGAEFRLRAKTAVRLPLLTLGFHIELFEGEEITTFRLADLTASTVAEELNRSGFSAGNSWSSSDAAVTLHLAEARLAPDGRPRTTARLSATARFDPNGVSGRRPGPKHRFVDSRHRIGFGSTRRRTEGTGNRQTSGHGRTRCQPVTSISGTGGSPVPTVVPRLPSPPVAGWLARGW